MILAIIAVNAWVGWRLEWLIPESSIDNVLELERRVAAIPDKAAVKVLVFGNSHAVAGLRPPAIARAFGVSTDEVFSLAMPGASPREMRLLAERHLPGFKGVRRAVCGVEEYFLSANPDVRLRYMTRGSLVERWRYASSFSKLDDRLGLLAAWAFPLADFAVPLRGALLDRPLRLARRLVEPVPVDAGSLQERLSAIPYPWGYPPPWDNNEVKRLLNDHWEVEIRAWHLVSGAEDIPSGLAELEALARTLEARGARLELAEMPYGEPLAAALTRKAWYYDSYKSAVQGYLKATGRTLLPRPAATSEHFYDLDHLNPRGAAMMADWLKKGLAAPAPNAQTGVTP